MKNRKRHSPEQIIRKLREADRMLTTGEDVAHLPGFEGERSDAAPLKRNAYGLRAVAFTTAKRNGSLPARLAGRPKARND